MASPIADQAVHSLAELNALAQTELIEAIAAGLPASLVRDLAGKMGVPLEEMARLLRLTPRTLQRRLDAGTLALSESERLWELCHLYFRAVEVLESERGAMHWFGNSIQALGGVTPLSYARTVVGLRELEDILGRIEHGVYS